MWNNCLGSQKNLPRPGDKSLGERTPKIKALLLDMRASTPILSTF